METSICGSFKTACRLNTKKPFRPSPCAGLPRPALSSMSVRIVDNSTLCSAHAETGTAPFVKATRQGNGLKNR